MSSFVAGRKPAVSAKAAASCSVAFCSPSTWSAFLLAMTISACMSADIQPQNMPVLEPPAPSVCALIITAPQSTAANPASVRAVRRSWNSRGESAITITGAQ